MAFELKNYFKTQTELLYIPGVPEMTGLLTK